MRVLLASPGMQIGGAEQVVTVLAAGLAQRGHQLALSGVPGPLDDQISDLPVQRLRLEERGRSPLGLARDAARLAVFVRGFRPHVIHAHNPRMSVAAALGARLGLGPRRPPLLATVHGLGPSDYRAAAFALRAAADRVASVSQETASELAGFGLTADVVYNGVEAGPPLSPDARSMLDAELGLDGGPVLAAVGRLASHKNHERFLVAAAEILHTEPEARFLLVGAGPQRAHLERQAGELGIADRVRFTGARFDVRALIARADLFVCSSDWEGHSVAALEALAAGTPVVSTPVEGMRALMAEGAAVVAADRSSSSLARAALDLLRDPRRREALGAAGMRAASERFAADAMVEAYDRMYAAMTRGCRV